MSSMSTTLTIVTIALASIGPTNGVFGQTPAKAPHTITAVGCVSPAVNDGSLSGSPGVPPSTPATAPILANSAQPTGAFLLNSATPPDATADARKAAASGQPITEVAVTYVLEGQQPEFQRLSGQLVEATGALVVHSRGTTSQTTSKVNHLKVTALRSLAPKCPGPPKLAK